jgi:putative acetyltransferase
MKIQIRPAMPDDAMEIVRVHYAAVHEIASACYSREILDAWSGPPGEKRHERVRRPISSGGELFIVAEVDGVMAGFGVIVPAEQEVRAVYVHPSMGRRGIGAEILRSLETLAAEHGIRRLQLNASINAEKFYVDNGYSAIEPGVHPLGSGVEMACIKMCKTL